MCLDNDRNCTLPKSATTSPVLVNRKGHGPDFMNTVSADVLPPSFGKDNDYYCEASVGSTLIGDAETCTTGTGKVRTEMKIVGRVESVQNERRGRSFFRTKEHKRR